jgi:hypothetical protein
MTELTVQDRLGLAETALREGRIIQSDWRRKDDSGRELVCALAAFGPDINSASACPADLMPPWMAEMVPVLDDGIAEADVPWFMGELLKRAKAWAVLDEAAWERIRTGYMIGLARQALASAAPVQPEPKPAYWQDIVDAVERVAAALEKGEPEELKAAEAAAWAAAWAAARAAAWAAARAAAWAAAWAAEAAAWAARAAAWAAAWAAEAAGLGG